MFGPGLVGGLSGQTESFTVVAKSGNLSKYYLLICDDFTFPSLSLRWVHFDF